jgi:hypothetical protein
LGIAYKAFTQTLGVEFTLGINNGGHMEVGLILVSFILGWLGFSYWSRTNMKWSKTISVGGGFIVGLVALGVSTHALLHADANDKAATQSLDFSIPATLKDEAKTLIHQKWPSVTKACPGLVKYSASLTYDGIDENFDYAPQDAQRIDVKYTVPNDSGIIPKGYLAAGHRCFFGISRDGTTALISKRPCQSICLDKDMTHNEKDVLRLPLK